MGQISIQVLLSLLKLYQNPEAGPWDFSMTKALSEGISGQEVP